MAHWAPGDPVMAQMGLNPRGLEPQTLDRLREELGLNDPLPVQYAHYLGRLLRGDLGRSLTTRAPVSREILARLPATLELSLAAFALVLLVAIPLGVVSATHRGSLVDHLSRTGALFGVSMPAFWLGLVLVLLFSLKLGWLPTSGRGDGTPWGHLKALILPAATLAVGMVGLVLRTMRSSLLEVLSQDYVRTAHAKGLAPRHVLTRHCLRNALLPVITVMAMQWAGLLGGAVVVETVFGWPGIGRLAVNAVWRRDYPVIVGTALLLSVVVLLINLAVDILYVAANPRIRYE
jgi:ABC-type dipeptide/oligopeptide/nickel transport system permease component